MNPCRRARSRTSGSLVTSSTLGQGVEQRVDLDRIDRRLPSEQRRRAPVGVDSSAKTAMRRSPRQASSSPRRRTFGTAAELDGFRCVHRFMMLLRAAVRRLRPSWRVVAEARIAAGSSASINARYGGAMTPPDAVLLDAGGIFLLPSHDRILGAFARAECSVEAELLDEAHYRGAQRFTTDLDVESDWAGTWRGYLEDYVEECGIPEDARADVHQHLDSEFADAGLWLRVIPGCREGLRALADAGVRLGVVSNADGLIAERLRALEILQVGPGHRRRGRDRHRLRRSRCHEAGPPHLHARARRDGHRPPSRPGTSVTCRRSTWWARGGPGSIPC